MSTPSTGCDSIGCDREWGHIGYCGSVVRLATFPTDADKRSEAYRHGRTLGAISMALAELKFHRTDAAAVILRQALDKANQEVEK